MRILHFLHKAIYITPLLANFVAAQSDNNLAQIQLMQNVEQYVVQQLSTADIANLSVNAMPLDARIEVPECPQPLTISASDEALQQANITVKASCESSGWYLFLMVKAVQMQNVATLSSAVSPGTLLTRSNVEIVEVDKKLLRTTTFADIESVLGARVKRRLQPGQPINPNQLCFVCKGDNIVISAGIQGLSIRTSGVAEQDGNIGDTIRVRNLSSDKVIAARVVSVKNVEVSI
jgi:flagellar basal body P-ring formation protein FlgA